MTIFSRLFTLFAALPTTKGPPPTSNHTYTLQHIYNSTNFFDKFEFLNLPDPATGLATYVNVSTAQDLGLAGITDGHIFLKADMPHNNPEGKRDSIWVQGREGFDAGTLFVIDMQSMPGNVCGAWSKLSTSQKSTTALAADINIVQTQALQDHNYMSLKTTPPKKCTFTPPQPPQTQNTNASNQELATTQLGTFTPATNCSEPWKGCIVQGIQGDVADGFNNVTAGGGIWAMALEHDGIRIWRFFRKDIPKEISSGGGVVDVRGWSTPSAFFQYRYEDDNCDIFGIFRGQALNFKIDFCGYGFDPGYWNTTGCAAATKYPNCEDFVRENPAVFGTVGWVVNEVRIYGH
ncbi:hypothetical protein EG328_001574 [Venturia inaequalis]|uniref:Uncharacterized protein n=2 Tax=Venturia inaequalis TaxID=5025 RepID=A0A8H3Z6D8_VENIN|nr:hypothetical protein EG328_001574 [Venturia inaequalis]